MSKYVEGMDWLFGAEYPKIVLANHPKGWAAGFFYGLYRGRNGVIDQRPSPVPLIKTLVKRKLTKLVRVQVLWDDSHKYKLADLSIGCVADALKDLEGLGKFCKDNGAILEVSPFCEHSVSVTEMTKVLKQVAKTCPSCVPVSTLWNTGIVKGFKNEVHGDYAPGNYRGVMVNYSLDGVDTMNADYAKARRLHRGRNVAAFYHWIPQFNRKRVIDDSTPRPERKLRPIAKQVKHLVMMAAISNFKGIKLPAKWVYKPQAEQHNVPTPKGRDCKPLILSPTKHDTMLLRHGKKSVKLYYSGTLEDGTHVMRSADWAVDILNRFKLSPDTLVDVVADGKVVGQVNLLLRAGRFR